MDPDVATRSVEDLRRQLRILRGEIADKVDPMDLDELRSELRRELGSTEDAISRVEARMAEHEETLDALGRDLRDELEKTTAALDRRLLWLERHVRASGGAITAPLDPDPELVELARRAERGRLLEEQLLDPAARSVEAGTVQLWETWQQQWHVQCLNALAASRRIINTALDDGER